MAGKRRRARDRTFIGVAMSQGGNTTDPLGATTAPTDRDRSPERKLVTKCPGLVQIFPRDFDRAPAVWPVRKRAVVGRARDAEIRLLDGTVSKVHVQLEPAPAGLRLVDLGSSHGTFLDGRAVGSAGALAGYGSVLRIGSALFLVCDDVGVHSSPMRRIAAGFLGLQRDVIAGPALCAVWQQVARVAALSHPVLITGETGSGKEAVARLIHAMRKTPGPFVALNLAAIPDGLFESELFGHARGAFTGATAPRAGAFAQASGGVLFVDEVGDLKPDLQVKLLRAIDQMSVRPLGANEEVPVTARVVAATSRDLRDACARDAFRKDLYYRLSGIVLQVPALREHRSDVAALASHFLQQESPQLRLSVQAAEALVLARWQGNIRELYYAVARASVQALSLGSSEVLPAHLPELDMFEPASDAPLTPQAIEAAIAEADGNASLAAKVLGVSRSTLYNVLKRDGVDPGTLRGRK